MSGHRVTSASCPLSPQSGHSSARFARPLSAMSGSHGANCCLSDRSFYERGTVIGTHVLGPAQGWAMPRHLKRDIHQIVVKRHDDFGHDASDMDHRGLAGHLVIIFVCSTSCGGSTLVAKRSWSFFTPSKAL